MPDLATVVPVFNVESIERTAEDMLDRRSRRRVEFESIDFNKRFIATVPRDHDPVALRELFSPAFIDWTTRIPAEVDFGITDQQLFFHWRLRERTGEELKEALDTPAGSSTGSTARWRRTTSTSTRPGPWNAGLEPFPADDRLASRRAFSPLASACRSGRSRALLEEVPEAAERAPRAARSRRRSARLPGPALAAAGEVAADLEVALPGEVRRVAVDGEAGPALEQGQTCRLAPIATSRSRAGPRTARGAASGKPSGASQLTTAVSCSRPSSSIRSSQAASARERRSVVPRAAPRRGPSGPPPGGRRGRTGSARGRRPARRRPARAARGRRSACSTS